MKELILITIKLFMHEKNPLWGKRYREREREREVQNERHNIGSWDVVW